MYFYVDLFPGQHEQEREVESYILQDSTQIGEPEDYVATVCSDNFYDPAPTIEYMCVEPLKSGQIVHIRSYYFAYIQFAEIAVSGWLTALPGED